MLLTRYITDIHTNAFAVIDSFRREVLAIPSPAPHAAAFRGSDPVRTGATTPASVPAPARKTAWAADLHRAARENRPAAPLAHHACTIAMLVRQHLHRPFQTRA